MNEILKYGLILPLAAPLFLTACVSQSKYDEVVAQNQQLQQQVSSLSAQVTRPRRRWAGCRARSNTRWTATCCFRRAAGR